MGNCSPNKEKFVNKKELVQNDLQNLLNSLKFQEQNGALYDKIGKTYFKNVRLYL